MRKCALIIMLLACCSLCSQAQKFSIQQKDGQKLEFKVVSKENKKVMLTAAVNKGASTLHIPNTVDYKNTSYEVVLVGDKALTGCDGKLRELSFPASVQEIGTNLFGNFMSMGSLMAGGLVASQHPLAKVTLESLTIPASVRSIGTSAFSTGREGRSAMMASVMSGGAGLKSLKAHIVELPVFVTDTQAEAYGLSRSSVTTYWAEKTPAADGSGTMLASQPATKKSTPTQPKIESDVDVNIPETSARNDKTFAVIIANENYQEEVNVDYALNDGEMFKTYCQKVLGLPAENIHMRQDATLNNINAEMDWLTTLANAYNGEATVIIYYAGHGIPDEATGTSYLLPVDGMGKNVNTGYSLSEFYKKLGEMPVKHAFVFMDACFSGAQRGNGMLASARGVAIRAKSQAPQGKMVVLSAAQGDETAYPYKEKGHGLFTYYLLKKLQDTKGNCSISELGDYVKQEVSRRSIVANQKSQTPVISYSTMIADSWQGLKLK